MIELFRTIEATLSNYNIKINTYLKYQSATRTSHLILNEFQHSKYTEALKARSQLVINCLYDDLIQIIIK